MDLSIAATDAVGWTSTTGNIPANTHHLSFVATNSQYGTIIAVSSSGGTLSTASAPFSNEIVPGAGWSGPTPTPGVQGNPTMSGYTASQPTIAQWDVVQRQVKTGTFNVGVIPDHSSDIDHVDIACNGGPWVTVATATANPDTANTQGIGVDFDATGLGAYSNGIVEYWAPVTAIAGVMIFRFIAYPKIGDPLVSEDLYVFGNADGDYDRTPVYVSLTGNDETGNGTLGNPYQSIRRGGWALDQTYGSCDYGTIYLMAGEWDYAGTYIHVGSNTTGFLTIMPAPGLTVDDVSITSSTAETEMDSTWVVRFKGLTIDGCAIRNSDGGTKIIWFDGCKLTGALHDGGQGFYNGWNNGAYYTDCEIVTCNVACEYGPMARNCYIHDLSEDVFRGVLLMANCLIEDVTKDEEHPDVWQSSGSVDNVITYGVQATDNVNAQGWTGLNVANGAWIKCNITNPSPWPFWLQAVRINNLFRESTIGNQVTVSDVTTDPAHSGSWYNASESQDNYSINSDITMKGGGPATIGDVPKWTEV